MRLRLLMESDGWLRSLPVVAIRQRIQGHRSPLVGTLVVPLRKFTLKWRRLIPNVQTIQSSVHLTLSLHMYCTFIHVYMVGGEMSGCQVIVRLQLLNRYVHSCTSMNVHHLATRL
jgi:hypothetical protein